LESLQAFEGDVTLESGGPFFDTIGHDVEVRLWGFRIREICRPGVSKFDIVMRSFLIIDDL
jgi:hypothetical protein